MPGDWIWAAVAVTAVGLITLVYNRLVTLRNAVLAAWHQIDVQLVRRHDLVPKLVNVVRGYMDHEHETLERLVRARSQALQAPNPGERLAAEAELDRALEHFVAVAEDHPRLRAHENAALLMEELVSTENRIGFARQHYNERVRALNNLVRSFPSNLVALALGFEEAPYYRSNDEREARSEVKFG